MPKEKKKTKKKKSAESYAWTDDVIGRFRSDAGITKIEFTRSGLKGDFVQILINRSVAFDIDPD